MGEAAINAGIEVQQRVESERTEDRANEVEQGRMLHLPE